jgi:hypothetical protein
VATLEFQTQSTAKSTPLRYFNKKDTADILLLCRFIMHVGHEIMAISRRAMRVSPIHNHSQSNSRRYYRFHKEDILLLASFDTLPV